MADLKPNKNKHLTFDERVEIHECLNKGMTFKAIGKRIGKDQTTVSKEVKRHITVRENNFKRTDESGRPIAAEPCPSLLKAPFVCNPCKKKHGQCRLQRQFYQAKDAHRAYEALLSEAREGIPLNKEEFYDMDKKISAGIKKGQHLYHIMRTHELGVSKSTVYRHLKKGYLSVGAIDFPRVVKFKERKGKRPEYVPKAAKAGRTYDDFQDFIEEDGIGAWVEMDTVIGRVGGKTIMTLHFTICNFMAGFLLEDKSSYEVSEKMKALKAGFAAAGTAFGDVMPLILTDNGGEFSDVAAVEESLDGEKETKLFFCDPCKSSQKPRVEKNHTMFRDIVPKGESFDGFTQETVSKVFSHVNSVKRKSLNGKTPYEVFVFAYGETAAKVLGIGPVLADEVCQSPKLLKKLTQ